MKCNTGYSKLPSVWLQCTQCCRSEQDVTQQHLYPLEEGVFESARTGRLERVL